MASALDIAYYIVRFFQRREDLITHLKLQKLLYYVQGWHLGLHHERAFDGEFQAWVHGPVNYQVYVAFKENRWSPILTAPPDPDIAPQLREHIDAVLAVYGGDTSWSLEQRTHRERPWIEARRGLPPDAECRTVIAEETMEQFFAEQAEDGEEDIQNT